MFLIVIFYLTIFFQDAARKSNAMVDSMNGKAKNGVSGAATAGGQQQQKRESTEQQGGSSELAPSTSSKRTSTSQFCL